MGHGDVVECLLMRMTGRLDGKLKEWVPGLVSCRNEMASTLPKGPNEWRRNQLPGDGNQMFGPGCGEASQER